jgi:hypothetical protein
MQKLTRKIAVYLRVLPRASRHRLDLVGWMGRRPQLLAGIGAYEGALLASNRADDRLKLLAQLRVSSLIGCPF